MGLERTIRLFLAIGLPEETMREVGRIQERLRRKIRGELRWVRPEGIHLTLKFFGDLPERAVGEISTVVGPAAAAAKPFAFGIAGTGVFPDGTRPRVLWLGLNGDVVRLEAFQKGLERALVEIGFRSEERPFRPHLTLARVRSPKGLTGIAEALEKGSAAEAGEFTAFGLGLFQSDLTPRGAVYTRLAAYLFAGREEA